MYLYGNILNVKVTGRYEFPKSSVMKIEKLKQNYPNFKSLNQSINVKVAILKMPVHLKPVLNSKFKVTYI